MFNLLVAGNGWADSRDSLLLERALEHTDDAIVARFKRNGQLDLAALIALPTLFMAETSGEGDSVARVGILTRTRISGKEIQLEYVYDPAIPALTNSRIKEFAAELDIRDWEFHRTHWAVKDVDLFRVLLRHMQPRRQMPRVFHISDPERIEPSLVSAMMPFDPRFDDVHAAIKKAAEAAQLRCRRADDIWENPAVIQDVVTLIDRSKIVVCDCSGRNSNVFYEAGIAHTLGREVILITQSDADIPFDLRHLRFVEYRNDGEGLMELSERLRKRFVDLAG